MKEFDRLFEIIKILRGENGCSWDKKQRVDTMRESLIEETYEIVDAIDSNSNEDLKEELGDLFFLSLFVSYIAEQEGRLKVEEVIRDVGDKLVRRHPHVFGSMDEKNADKIIGIWEDVKKNEEKNKERKRIFDDRSAIT